MNATTGLTNQEKVVLSLVAQGKRNTQIAQDLYISVRTVESHIHRILRKLQLSTRTEAALYAFQNGLMSKSEQNKNSQDIQVRHKADLISIVPRVANASRN